MHRALIVSTLFVTSCVCNVSDDTLHRVLEAEGFTKIESTGLAPFSCGRHDGFSSGFKAIGRNGKPVTGVVCCGMMKSCTVRID